MKTSFKSFEEIVRASVKYPEGKENEEYQVTGVKLQIEGKTLNPHTVSICHRDFIFYCGEGVVSYVVDLYGDEPFAEAVDWEFEDGVKNLC